MTRRRLLLLLGLAGCSSTPPRLYTLVAVPGPVVDRAPRTLGLQPVGLPLYLDRPQILRSTDEVELRLADAERWAEPLGAMIQRVLAENLMQRLPGATMPYGAEAVMLPAVPVMEVNFSRFDVDSAGSVQLAAQAELRRSAATASVRRIAPRHSVAPRSRETRDLVLAMSEALGRLADDLARMAVRNGGRGVRVG